MKKLKLLTALLISIQLMVGYSQSNVESKTTVKITKYKNNKRKTYKKTTYYSKKKKKTYTYIMYKSNGKRTSYLYQKFNKKKKVTYKNTRKYYSNGKLKEQKKWNYINGKIKKNARYEVRTYYSNGKLKRVIKYKYLNSKKRKKVSDKKYKNKKMTPKKQYDPSYLKLQYNSPLINEGKLCFQNEKITNDYSGCFYGKEYVKFSSSNNSIATIDQDGLFKVKKSGKVTFNVKGGTYYFASILKPQSITLNVKYNDKSVLEKGSRETIFKKMNELRKSKGLKPLAQGDAKMQAYANTRAKELVTLFEHARPSGTPLSYAGENIAAAGFFGDEATESKLYPKMYYMWYNSPGHYGNMINSYYDSASVGVYYDVKTGNIYGVQVFGVDGWE